MVKYTNWIGFFILVSLVLSSSKTFLLWSQVTYLWNTGLSPFEIYSEEQAHFLRYMLTYPIFYIASVVGVHHDLAFSILICILYLLNVSVLSQTMKLQSDGKLHDYIGFTVSILFLLLYFFSNGRGPLALFGYSLIIGELVKNDFTRGFKAPSFLYCSIGMFFCSISTGVMLSATLVLITFVMTKFYSLLIGKLALLRFIKQILVIFLLFFLFGKAIIVAINKNLDYYDGGIDAALKMLNHGWGTVIYQLLEGISGQFFITLAVSTFLIGSLFSTLIFKNSIQAITFVSLLCGAYGYTTFVMAIIPLMFLFNYWSNLRPPANETLASS